MTGLILALVMMGTGVSNELYNNYSNEVLNKCEFEYFGIDDGYYNYYIKDLKNNGYIMCETRIEYLEKSLSDKGLNQIEVNIIKNEIEKENKIVEEEQETKNVDDEYWKEKKFNFIKNNF